MVSVCGSGIPFVGCNCMNVDGQVHALEVKMYIPVVFKLLVWCGAEGYVSAIKTPVLSSWHFISTY